MTNNEALEYAKQELKAAYERVEKIGRHGKTRYIEILEMIVNVLEDRLEGEWILNDESDDYLHTYKCSNCGKLIYAESKYDLYINNAYCGKCGAKMVEPQERSE